MPVTVQTIKKLFALSGNVCAFPKCRAPIYDTVENVITGQICHIKGKSPMGPRYDPNQTEEERDGYGNLMLMCSLHNKIVDTNSNTYTVEVLMRYKYNHEARYKNQVLQAALLQRFADRFRVLLDASAPWKVRMALRYLRTEDVTGSDEYLLQLSLTNISGLTFKDPELELTFPKSYSLLAPFLVREKFGGLLPYKKKTSLRRGRSVVTRLDSPHWEPSSPPRQILHL